MRTMSTALPAIGRSIGKGARSRLSPRVIVGRLRDALPQGHAIAEEVWQRRHRGMLWLLAVHVPIVVVYAVLTGKGVRHGFVEAIAPVAALGAARFGPKTRHFQSLAATIGLVMCSAILVHLSGGIIEIHFHYFVILAAISLYHDWTPFLVAIFFVGVEHGLMGALDPRAVYNHPDAIAHPWKWAGIHAGFVLAASAISLVRWKSSEVEALKDPLTWLPNRALFSDRLRQALVRVEQTDGTVAVMFLDVDDFKAINDTAGHHAGDRLLIVVADRLRATLRPVDTVARLGGDEFAIVLEDLEGPDEVEQVAERILEALRAPLQFEGRQLSVTASVGIAMRTDGSTGETELVRNADIAMYVAKKSGKGRSAFFESSMHQAVMERTELAKDLAGAVERDELRILYQPIFELEGSTIAGFEALLRWEHPTLGTIAPPRFIPVAEENGLVVPIGRWVLETACAQACSWDELDTGWKGWMAVNVSVRQLKEESFVDDVLVALRTTGLRPEQLILEITESAMVGDSEDMVRRLHELKALGVRLALDDFGTGYSSLGHLRRLPIDILKIDKSFVDGLDQGAEEAALAKAVLKIAESIGLRCVAEGVEREAQARELRAAGCEFAQGFLFSKPIEVPRVDALLTWRPQAPEPRGTILIVDADVDAREAVSRRLRRAGFATLEAGSGASALGAIHGRQIDLLLVNIPLADMHPIDLAGAIKNDPVTASIPILAMSTAPSSPESGADSLARVADRHLRKPVPDSELLDQVQNLIREAPPETASA
jgi:diguanylate cyclase (GGDEF)-like protein